MRDRDAMIAVVDALSGSGTSHFSDPPDELYHYTSLDSFVSIVENQNIWATSHRYMNDPNELRIGIGQILSKCIEFLDQPGTEFEKILKSTLRDTRENGPDRDVFVTSFCDADDVLNQWRLYGKGNPALCLSFNMNTEFRPPTVACTYNTSDQDAVFDRVSNAFYRALKISERAVQLGEDCREMASYLTAVLMEQVVLASATAKPKGFSEEREWRSLVANGAVGIMPVRYRRSPYGIAPYIELPIMNGNGLPRLLFNSLSLSGVTIGPGVFAQDHARDVTAFLALHGFEVPVRTSNAQFR